MKPRVLHKLKEKEAVEWSYPNDFIPGALRLIEVKPLLSKSNSKLVLYEFPELSLNEADKTNPSLIPNYVALSHVWKPSPAIAGRQNNRPLHIKIKEGTSVISWLGLMQSAIASSHLKCDYLWLDFVCIHQTSNEDKKLQIKNMVNIYAYCSAAIVMLGGMRSAQRLEDESSWHTRAWTLQEALESIRRERNAVRYALIEWNYDKTFDVFRQGFQRLEHGLAIVPIRELLSLQGNDMPIAHIQSAPKYGPRIYDDHILLPVNCFGKNKDVMTSLLRLLFAPREWVTTYKREPYIWRSLWVRTSSMEHDIMYSSMNLFNPPIPLQVDYDVDFNDIIIQFLELLHEKSRVPYWLQIGHRIPVCAWSGLFPQRPHFQKHDLPTYKVGGMDVNAYELLCSDGCCDNIDICIEIMGASKQTGHIICTKLLKLVRVARTDTLPVYTNRCWQHVRKILLSYIPGDISLEPEIWNFEIDPDAAVDEVETYPQFDRKTTNLNAYDNVTGRPVVPMYNKNEVWNRSPTKGADLTPLEHPFPKPMSVDLTALCWFDGRLGPYVSIIGFHNSHYQNPVVYFLDRTKDGNIQRVGAGKLLLAEEYRIRSDMPWRHVRVGGRGMVEPAITKCCCERKREVPVIKKGEDDWWSDTW